MNFKLQTVARLQLPALKIDNLFDRYMKLEENRNTVSGEGSGLGLAVVKELVEGMNGTVKASLKSEQESEKSRGIEISMIFPRSQ